MHSYIINAPNSLTEQQFWKTINKALKLPFKEEDNNPYNLQPDSHNLVNSPDIFQIFPDGNAIKIKQIREIQQKFFQKPFKLPYQIFIIHNAETMTTASQNAFLKTLEEPGETNKIFLITSNPKSLLTTIQSRCQIIKIKNTVRPFKDESANPSTDELTEEFKPGRGDPCGRPQTKDLITQISQAPLTKRLTLIESHTKTKQDAQQFIQETMTIVRNILLANNNLTIKQFSNLLKNLQEAHNDLQSNVNIKLAMDNLVLKWDRK